MRKIINLLFILGLISVLNYQTTAQNDKTKRQKTVQEKLQELEDETKYLSPVRYVIVYDELFELSSMERRVELVMDEKQFNEENLIKVLELIKKRFPSPFVLRVEVHTNLATIETPEEREKADSSTGRLTNKSFLYKKANYSRFSSAREAFTYTTNLRPFERKTVVLIDKP